jgi:AraC-like DNA-binding protein
MAQLLGFILVATLLTARPRSIANRLLAAALLCVVFRQFVLVLTMFSAIASFPMLFRMSFPFQLLAIPAFYLYAVALTTPDFRIERKHAVHLLPFAVGVVWYGAVLVWGGPSPFELGTALDRELYARTVVKLLVMIPYLILVRRQVQTFAREVKQHVSDTSPFRLNWLRTLLVLAGASVAVDVLDVATGPSIPLWYLTPGVSLISLIVLSYLSMRVSPIFTSEVHRKQEESVPDVVLPQAEAEEVPIDASPGRLPDAELEKQKERLTGIVVAKSLYLNPDLRLSDLADAMGVRPYRVSQILNQGLHTSFYDLINQYRIEKAQELLTSPAADRLNLLGVAMESGFRSKSVFNEVFKKTTGKTPSQYRDGKTSESSDSVNRIARSGR